MPAWSPWTVGAPTTSTFSRPMSSHLSARENARICARRYLKGYDGGRRQGRPKRNVRRFRDEPILRLSRRRRAPQTAGARHNLPFPVSRSKSIHASSADLNAVCRQELDISEAGANPLYVRCRKLLHSKNGAKTHKVAASR